MLRWNQKPGWDERQGMKHRILIADEADLMLLGIETILQNYPGADVIGTARSGGELLAKSKGQHPDIIILNERLDALIDVLALTERLKQVSPQSRLIVVGSLAEGLLIRDLFACDVLAYLFAGDDLRDHLVAAVQAVAQRRPYLSPTANSAYLVAMQSPLRDWQLDPEARAMLRLLMGGVHIADIARQLDIPMRRAYFLRHKLKQRFGAATNEHLISRAVSEGFIVPEV
ncbi:MAG: response regulator transcription factor [Anaerolineaceae bacterium]|nr:response regulator transcription factor [Anaerolineaceae bacterium]